MRSTWASGKAFHIQLPNAQMQQLLMAAHDVVAVHGFEMVGKPAIGRCRATP